ncbi:Putative DNA-binding domain-containing protein [Sphingomonas antarctica]|uniref:HvfC/BufC family peptide modification chaperone n=1 Tax=Sphingomonas antarctica TaxID=2040274 RepID=UPI0039E99833
MSLLALQRDFRRNLVGETLAASHSEARGMAVYHNAYRVQLTDCLAETFAQTHAWLGGEAFVVAARAHIEARPPSGWTLAAYGDDFDRTLTTLYPDDPEIAELARLEWLLSRAFEGADAEGLSVEGITGVDWEQAELEFVPSMRIVPVRTNAGAIWSALTAELSPPDAALLPSAMFLIVWRQGFTPCFRSTDAIEHGAIDALIAGASFATLCAKLVADHGEAQGVALAGSLLGQWIADGLLFAVRGG